MRIVSVPVLLALALGPAAGQPAPGPAHAPIEPAPGADLPDLVNCFILGNPCPGTELIGLSFHGTATGPLRESAGLGPEGTPGRVIVSQTGLIGRGSGQGATADGFPVERVELRAIGH